ncbi:uncharacterized protein LOC128285437 [Gossypium arboreum]|uniref:uncharacterized protein LOC128285437 n=1 Tax=Gossypium arboreum TaxID=29729 RepID=UPI0022F18D07|nr:uncharacterized protein LOC128285437 [Gossypium arboreum]
MESNAFNGRMARWQILLFEFDIIYVSQKAVKGSTIADFLASQALEDYEPLNFDFPNKEIVYVAPIEEGITKDHYWKLNFDGASNAVGNGIGAVLVSLGGDHSSFTCKLDFDCTNNMAKYETCIMGLQTTIERKIKLLETRDSKLINYRRLVLGLVEEFDDITFNYLPRDENQMVDTLSTLDSMIKVSRQEDVKPIQMSVCEAPSYCYNIEEEERDDHPWYQDILRYVRNREYPDQATENDKRTLRRLAYDYVLNDKRTLRRLAYDYVLNGPISRKASNGYRFIFVVIAYFTKWVEAALYANVTKLAVSRFLKRGIICRYRMLERIISDNALNLNNDTIAEEEPAGGGGARGVYGGDEENCAWELRHGEA